MHPRGVGACASRAVQRNARHFPPLPRARALRTMEDCEDADIEYHEDDPAEAAADSLSDDLRPRSTTGALRWEQQAAWPAPMSAAHPPAAAAAAPGPAPPLPPQR